MATSNSCECPYPPGGRVECDPGDAAACYVNEQGEAIGKCIRISQQLQEQLQQANEMQQQSLLSSELGKEFEIPLSTFLGAEWVSQSVDDGIVVSIQFSQRSSLNAK